MPKVGRRFVSSNGKVGDWHELVEVTEYTSIRKRPVPLLLRDILVMT